MEYAICIVAAAPVRKEPDHRSEMVNQLLFGETMKVIEEKDEWLRIKSLYDDYEGWLTHHLITEVGEAVALQEINFYATGLINGLRFSNQLMNIPFGSSLPCFNEATNFLWNKNYQYEGVSRKTTEAFDKNFLWKTVCSFLYAPYLWGGKTFMGVDCSGFVQTVYKVLGIKLKRDAYLQAEQGIKIENVSVSKVGDLAFFHNDHGKIIHVGIISEENLIAHASGKVRIDTLDEKGIVNIETGRRTHHLHSIRRVIAVML